jgi:hypothetical protein
MADNSTAQKQWVIMLPRLIELAATDISHGKIAAALSAEFGCRVTRNAVIGKVARDRIARPERRIGNEAKTRNDRPKRRKVTWLDEVLPPRRKPLATSPLATADPITLMDLRPHHCRWPLGEPSDMLYCGAGRLEPHPYCAGHAAIAYERRSRGRSKPFVHANLLRSY